LVKRSSFTKEKRRMTKWNKTIAAASLLVALCPAVAPAQVVEYVDDQGQKLQVGSNPSDPARRGQVDGTPSKSSELSSLNGEKPGQSKADKEFADQQRDAVRKKAPEKPKQVCRWGAGAPDASNNFSVSRSCK
jgi:hypothetical protein